ncbi:hypothetical protein CWB96_05585 [Pseudoalteromonas citrea]|uniref:Uncharacterized protein n=1 Tax=Pseudoalteromonas citrea TaxID=43655 RepID=A0A5S3XTU0_9GAMM|nr:hypothetical protein [Pseudoalteromonas citrea]TMP46124.1 hypothetical protein CWB97_02615 [Pseudoalteromonas citrea]TMP60937.1 hypothetical protein CWB96_05585 [Pseudoalteromonas citrea]
MSKQAKKQSLLGQTQGKRPNRRPTQKKTNPTANNTATNSTPVVEEKSSSKAKWLIMGILVIFIIAFPKPKLLTYEKLGLVAQSIYWPGLPGVDPVLLDSTLYPQPALDRNTLYLCADRADPKTCHKYQIIEQKGIFSVIYKYILD